MRRLLRYAAQVTSFNRAYLDSGFYTTDAVRALESTGTEFIIQAPDKGRKIEGLQRLAVAKESEVEAVAHGVGGVDDEKHWLFTMKSQKRSRLRQGEPDDPTDDWIIFYTNIPLDDDDVDPLELATNFRNHWGAVYFSIQPTQEQYYKYWLYLKGWQSLECLRCCSPEVSECANDEYEHLQTSWSIL